MSNTKESAVSEVPFKTMYGPYEMEMNLHFTDGERVASARVSCGHGNIPTASDMREIIANAVRQLKEEMGEEWRLASKREYFDAVVAEITGVNMSFAMPGPDNFDAWPSVAPVSPS